MWLSFPMGSSVKCPNLDCQKSSVIKKGVFHRRYCSRPVQRYHCKGCHKHFSAAIFSRAYRQKKRHVNQRLHHLLSSAVTQRRCAFLCSLTRKTVARRVIWFGHWARVNHARFIETQGNQQHVHFDELETFEHTKCKPLSVPLAVSHPSRAILGFQVATMPAKGHLSKIALRKYGYRKDGRGKAIAEVLSSIRPLLSCSGKITSDEAPRYPALIRRHMPDVIHEKTKGLRGCYTGQGELKRAINDPLFSLNHTCAMLRANIQRLIRKTWSTTKRIDRFYDHLSIYVDFHNRYVITGKVNAA